MRIRIAVVKYVDISAIFAKSRISLLATPANSGARFSVFLASCGARFSLLPLIRVLASRYFSLIAVPVSRYFSPPSMKYNPEWFVVAGLLLYFYLVAEPSKPFVRPFRLSDPTIQYPFATSERVTDNQLYIISCIFPSLAIAGWCTALLKRNKLTRFQFQQLLNTSLLNLWLSISITGVLTDVLKAWIARHRPDFLERCGPIDGTPIDQLVGIEVCSAPLGQMYLVDGMKSTPSGHSLVAFAGLFYLNLWIYSRVGHLHMGYQLASCAPSLLAAYIALSRTQDYRHHYSDIIIGSAMGIGIATVTFLRGKREERKEPELPR